MVPCYGDPRKLIHPSIKAGVKGYLLDQQQVIDFYTEGQWCSKTNLFLEFGLRLIWQMRDGVIKFEGKGEFQELVT